MVRSGFATKQRCLITVVIALSVILGFSSFDVGGAARDWAHAAVENGTKVGRITGRITRGPARPVGRANDSASKPAAGIKIYVTTPAGREAGFAATDKQGTYSVSLPAGTYRIETKSLGGMEFTKDLPATVVVTEGRETRLDVHIDTGIR